MSVLDREPDTAAAGPGDLLDQHRVEPEVARATTAVLLGNHEPEQPLRAGRGPQLARHDPGRLPGLVVRHDLLVAERARRSPGRRRGRRRTGVVPRAVLLTGPGRRRRTRSASSTSLDAPVGECLPGVLARAGRRSYRGRSGYARTAAPARAAGHRRARRTCRGPPGAGVSPPSGSTGATQASVPSNTAVHSAWVRVANVSASTLRSSGQRAGSLRSGSARCRAAGPARRRRRLQRADRHVLAVRRLVHVVERRPGVEQVPAALVAPPAAGQVRPSSSWSGVPHRPRSPRRRPGRARSSGPRPARRARR